MTFMAPRIGAPVIAAWLSRRVELLYHCSVTPDMELRFLDVKNNMPSSCCTLLLMSYTFAHVVVASALEKRYQYPALSFKSKELQLLSMRHRSSGIHIIAEFIKISL